MVTSNTAALGDWGNAVSLGVSDRGVETVIDRPPSQYCVSPNLCCPLVNCADDGPPPVVVAAPDWVERADCCAPHPATAKAAAKQSAESNVAILTALPFLPARGQRRRTMPTMGCRCG